MRRSMRRGGVAHRCRRGATSACCLSAISKALTASVVWNGVAPTACRCGNSCVSPSATLYNLGLIIRLLTGAGTPREFRVRASAWLFAIPEPDGTLIVLMLIATGDQPAPFAVKITPDSFG